LILGFASCANTNRIEKKTYYPNNAPDEHYYLKDGKKDGEYKSYYENGKLAGYGSFENNLMVGEWKTYYENGSLLSVVNYVLGLQTTMDAWDQKGNHVIVNGTGTLTVYYENGNPKHQSTYKNSKGTGKNISWYENGKKKLEFEIKDGKVISSKSWDEDGNLLEDEIKWNNK
jgi:antitoxin component YwqK of YwqJK toxin-antitoxin module